MSTKSNAIKCLVMASVLGAGLFAQREARAACVNDDDCPGAACGGEVCDWLTKGLNCTAAGAAPKGQDGWCTDDTDCKCRSLGATCVSSFCTFTLPSQAPGASASGGASGSSGGATGSGGASNGGATGSGGATSGNDGGAQPAKDDGGCSVVGGGAASGLGAAIALLGLLVVVRRRRS